MSDVLCRNELLRHDFVLFTTRPDPKTNRPDHYYADIVRTMCHECGGYRDFLYGYKRDEVGGVLARLSDQFHTEVNFDEAREFVASKKVYADFDIKVPLVRIAYNLMKEKNNQLLRDNATVKLCRSCLKRDWDERFQAFHNEKMARVAELEFMEGGKKKKSAFDSY